MATRQVSGRLVFRDAPGPHWLLAILFLSIGALLAAVPLGLFATVPCES